MPIPKVVGKDIFVVGAVGAVGNLEGFPSGCWKRGAFSAGTAGSMAALRVRSEA